MLSTLQPSTEPCYYSPYNTHTRRRAHYMCGCAWPRQNAAELHASIHTHHLHSIELKSNQRIDNWEWWRKKKKKLFCSYPCMLLRWINSTSQINWQLNPKCVQYEYRERFCITATPNHTQGLRKANQQSLSWSMGGWWRPEMILQHWSVLKKNHFNCQKRIFNYLEKKRSLVIQKSSKISAAIRDASS